jgi:hypothetical protein
VLTTIDHPIASSDTQAQTVRVQFRATTDVILPTNVPIVDVSLM